MYLVAAATRRRAGRSSRCAATRERLETALEAERAERVEVGKQLDDAVLSVNLLLAKLAASSGTISADRRRARLRPDRARARLRCWPTRRTGS